MVNRLTIVSAHRKRRSLLSILKKSRSLEPWTLKFLWISSFFGTIACKIISFNKLILCASRYVENVFSHVACFNASFLRADGLHYGCSAKNHGNFHRLLLSILSYYFLLHSGLDLDLAAETFAQISRVENTSVCELVSPFL